MFNKKEKVQEENLIKGLTPQELAPSKEKDNVKKEPEKKNQTMFYIIIMAAFLLMAHLLNNRSSNSDKTTEKDKQKEITMYVIKKETDEEYTFVKPTAISKENITTYTYSCLNNNCIGIGLSETYAVIKDGDTSFIYNYQLEQKLIENLDILSTKFNDDIYPRTVTLKSNNDKYGLYNLTDKKLTIPMEYDNIKTTLGTYENDVTGNVIVTKNSKEGVISKKTGNIVIEIKYDNITYPGNNIYKVEEKNTYKYFDLEGKLLYSGKTFDEIYTIFNINYALAKQNSNVIVIDKDGEKIETIGEIKDDYKFILYSPGQYTNHIIIFETTEGKCISYTYDTETKENKVSDIECPGI